VSKRDIDTSEGIAPRAHADTAGAKLNLQNVFNELREDFSVADSGKALKAVERAIAAGASNERADAEKDAARYRWLAARFLGADFDWNEQGVQVLCFEMSNGMRISADIDASIDAAILAAKEK
jgi:hypothetical protein